MQRGHKPLNLTPLGKEKPPGSTMSHGGSFGSDVPVYHQISSRIQEQIHNWSNDIAILLLSYSTYYLIENNGAVFQEVILRHKITYITVLTYSAVRFLKISTTYTL